MARKMQMTTSNMIGSEGNLVLSNKTKEQQVGRGNLENINAMFHRPANYNGVAGCADKKGKVEA